MLVSTSVKWRYIFFSGTPFPYLWNVYSRLAQWFLKCDPWTRNFSIIRELVKSDNCTELETLGWGPEICVLMGSPGNSVLLKFRIHWSRWSQNFLLALPFWLLTSVFPVTLSSCQVSTHWRRHYFSVMGRPGSRAWVRSASLTQTVLVTDEGIEIKGEPLSLRWELVWVAAAARSGWARGVAWGSDPYRIRLWDTGDCVLSTSDFPGLFLTASALLPTPRWPGYSDFLCQWDRICQSKTKTSEETAG